MRGFTHCRSILLIKPIALSAVLIGLLIASANFIPIGWDFKTFFLPAGEAILNGQNPYSVEGFYNPPWLAAFFVPFALIPESIAWIVYFSLSITAFVLALRRLKLRPFCILLIMASSFVFYSLWYGNIDGFVLLGATLPPWLGIWLLLLKPQMSIGLVVLWAYSALLTSWKKFLLVFGPPGLVYFVCWIIGVHPAALPIHQTWNIQAWPWGLLFGVALIWLAIQHNDPVLGLSASPYISPYAAPQTWMVTLLPATRIPAVLVIGILLSWTFVILRMVLKVEALKFEPILLIAWSAALMLISLREQKTMHKKVDHGSFS
jgi:hypothetical protein